MAASLMIAEGAVRLNRAVLLRKLGLQYDTPFTGDIAGTRPLLVNSLNAVKVHQINAPFLNFGATFERCSGSKLLRVDRTTVAIPCFSCEIKEGGSVCAHCEELWNSGPDEDGFFVLDKKSMKNAAAFYTAGAGNSIFRLPALNDATEKYLTEIDTIKALFGGTCMELDADWPNCTFKQIIESVMIDAGVVHKDSGKKANPYKRLASEQQHLGDYMTQMVKLWLRIRAYISVEDLLAETKVLADTAQVVVTAAESALQQSMTNQPVYCGALSVADVMLAGFTHAATAFDVLVAASVAEGGEAPDTPEFWWGPRVEEFKTWAETVKTVPRARKRKIPTKSGAPPAAKSSQPNAAPNPRRKFYAVAVGRVPGVYKNMTEVREQTDGLPRSGPDKMKMKVFTSEADAEQYVNRHGHAVQMSKPSESSKKFQAPSLYVAVGGSRPGVYEHEAVAKFYADQKNGVVTQVSSFAEGRKLLNMPSPPYFRESTVPSQEVIDLSSGPKPNHEGKFFVVLGGGKPGVYCSETEAFDIVTNNGGVFTPYLTKAEAQSAFEAAKMAERGDVAVEPPMPKNAFVVWAGRSVGVMTRDACMKATVGLAGVRMKGPMAASEAFALWMQKEAVALVLDDKPRKRGKFDSPAPQANSLAASAGVAVDMPADEELEKAEGLGITRVFACRAEGRVRIALSYEAAKAGFEYAEVSSFFQKATLIENLGDAEVWAQQSQTTPNRQSFKERYATARKKLFSPPTTPTKRAANTNVAGQSHVGSGFLGFKGMVRSKRVLQMQRCFIDCGTAIRVDAMSQPSIDELDEDNIELPGSATYMLSPARPDGPIKIEDWFEERKNVIRAWPLMSFSEFLSFCRHAIKVCSQSSKPVAIINSVALNELVDIAIRLHRHMSRLGTLGQNEVRFKSRMFLHLQVATMKRVVYTGASAMAVFKEATEVFMTRLPKSASSTTVDSATSRAKKANHDRYQSDSPKKTFAKPKSGCWLCASADHYCSDRARHPVDASHMHKMPSAQVKKEIFQRVDNSPHPVDWKDAEKKRMKDFWSRRCKP